MPAYFLTILYVVITHYVKYNGGMRVNNGFHLSNPIDSMDAKKILERASKERGRVPYQFSIDADLVKKFKDYVSTTKIPASRIIEELMKEFLENALKGKK